LAAARAALDEGPAEEVSDLVWSQIQSSNRGRLRRLQSRNLNSYFIDLRQSAALSTLLSPPIRPSCRVAKMSDKLRLIVFTLPAPIGDIACQNKPEIYDILFKASAEALTTIAADPKHLGARVGITSVLHTWGSALTHHPHVHMIVPGGGISLDGTRWVSCRPGFFLPVRVLSRLFRRLFLERLLAAAR
jgi:hypothetical protein